MTNAEKLTLAKHACHIRMGVIEGTHSAKCGHPGGSLDIAEVLSYLYFVEMNVDPKAPGRTRTVTVWCSPRATQPPACTQRWPSAASSRWKTSRLCARSAATCRATPI